VTEMFCKRMAVIHMKGRARLEALREEHRVESERLLEVFGEVLAAAREATEPDQDIPEPPAGPCAGDEDGVLGAEAAPASDDVGEADAGDPVDEQEEMARRAGALVLKALASARRTSRSSASRPASHTGRC